MTTKWNTSKPSDAAWRAPKRLTRAQATAEQDTAAGGRDPRLIQLPNGRTATGSVCLRLPAENRRIYAYLRWSQDGRNVERYICQVDGEGRAENLAAAWEKVRGRGLTDQRETTTARPNSGKSWASSDAVRAVMRGNKGRDTRPELALRSAVHALGLRYRVGVRPLSGVRRTADLVFAGPRVAVFLDGCFWHGCHEHYRPSVRNSEFWTSKIEGTQARDIDTDRRLAEAGWTPVRVWEHENPELAAQRIAEIVLRARTGHV